jgi:hypothetical protein
MLPGGDFMQRALHSQHKSSPVCRFSNYLRRLTGIIAFGAYILFAV